MKVALGTKPTIVSETGWPSSGNATSFSPLAIPSQQNEASYFASTEAWAHSNNVPLFYMESHDEPWKATDNNDYSSWGILDSSNNLKPGMQAGLDGQAGTLASFDPHAPTQGPGTPKITLTSVPPVGDATTPLVGQMVHAAPADYNIVVYIKVGRTGG